MADSSYNKSVRNKTLARRLVASVMLLVGVALIVLGWYGMNIRGSRPDLLKQMRTAAMLDATGEGAAEGIVKAHVEQARADAKASGASLSQLRDIVAKAEEEARANMSSETIDITGVDTTVLDAPISELETAQKAYSDAYAAEESAYIAKYIEDHRAEAEAAAAAEEEALLNQDASSGETVSLDETGLDDALDEKEPEITVDMSGFAPSDALTALQTAVDDKFAALGAALKAVYPTLPDESLATLKDTILNLNYNAGADFEDDYDRYAANNGLAALSGGDLFTARVARNGDDLITLGIGLLIYGLMVMFYPQIVKKLGVPRLIISMFFVLLCLLATMFELSITTLLSNTLVRMGMNSILVLAMVPAIQCGISLNLGLPLGIIGGLIGGLLCIEFGYSGWWGFIYAIAIGMAISAVIGWLYGMLLNKLKGNEMAVTTYVGFSAVSLMCIAWLVLPFKSLALKWPLGDGLRMTLSMKSSYRKILNDFLSFEVFGIDIPTGLLLFMILCCVLVWLFSRSKTGIAMQAGGANPRFAEATGINVNRTRIIGTMLSTMLGAVGIIVYSQSYGFMQLYTAPRTMGFIAASAILIGGATTSKARISHVIIGAFLFQGVLTLGMPVANVLVPQSTISETMRILISNGIILYALTKSGGGSRA